MRRIALLSVVAALAALAAHVHTAEAHHEPSHFCPPGQEDKSCLEVPPPTPSTTTSTTTTPTTTTPTTTTPTTTSPSACGGLSVSPGTDIQALIDANPSGTSFCLRSGTHRLSHPIVPKSYNRLVGEPGAILNGSKVVSTFTQAGPYWVAAGQTQQVAPSGSCVAGYDGCALPEGVFLDDRNLWQVTALAQLTPGTFFFDYANDRIYLADNPSGRKVEASTVSHALIGYDSAQSNVTISNLTIEKFTNAEGATVRTGRAWIVQSNEIRLNHGAGVFANSSSLIQDNDIHHNGQYGVVGSAEGAVVASNEIAFNNTEGFDPKWNAGGTKFGGTVGLRLLNNFVHDNNGPGLACDGNNQSTLYEGNTIRGNTGPGIVHEISYNATVRSNRVENNATATAGKSIWWGADILMYDARDVEIVGNVVVSRNNAIGLVDVARGAGTLGVFETRNVYVHDNEIRMYGGSVGLVGDASSFEKNNRFQNNRYYLGDVNGRYFDWKNPVTLLTGQEWQALGQETTGSFLPL